jgi:uncharacterized protein YegJ (DUF2314 family)
MAEKVFFADGADAQMEAAVERAQASFKYFWRELYWEYRRIIPALDLAMVKVPFLQAIEGTDESIVEHMWIDEVEFDGEKISGVLINEPNELTNIENGDAVSVAVADITDWLFVNSGKTYGGFTIQVMRSQMSAQELAAHDNAWGLDFGDHKDILLVYQQKEEPANLIEHPMSKNMKPEYEKYIAANPNELNAKDEDGYTLLHREAIAGNRSSVEALLALGADQSAKTNSGKTALDFARAMNWEHLVSIL